MGLFDFLRKSPTFEPYGDSSINFIYNLLFCDNIELLRKNAVEPISYPRDILMSPTSTPPDLQRIIDDPDLESRTKALAYHLLFLKKIKPEKKELLGVIVEVALDEGLDTLAAYADGTARYINHTGKMTVWEAADEVSTQLITDLFANSRTIVEHIGPWDKPRRPAPSKGMARISFLVSGELYFGEGPVDAIFNDPMARAAFDSATALMMNLIERTSKD